VRVPAEATFHVVTVLVHPSSRRKARNSVILNTKPGEQITG
jgi:hypothetical protein